MIDYRQSGVDVEEGYKAVSKYKDHAKRTKYRSPERSGKFCRNV